MSSHPGFYRELIRLLLERNEWPSLASSSTLSQVEMKLLINDANINVAANLSHKLIYYQSVLSLAAY